MNRRFFLKTAAAIVAVIAVPISFIKEKAAHISHIWDIEGMNKAGLLPDVDIGADHFVRISDWENQVAGKLDRPEILIFH